MMLALALWLGVTAPGGVSAAEAVARGDEHYAHRDQGAAGARADPHRVEQAMLEYRRALALEPGSNGARYRLLRAFFFRATFCGAGPEEQRRLSGEAKRVSEEGLERIRKDVGQATGAVRLAALRKVPDAAPLFFWAAAAWGEWAERHSRMSAASQGAAARVRDLAQSVIDLDPELEEGGGYRILGRLHDVSPRIPLLTGWVSRKAALENLRRANELAPDNTVNQLFLAEAILRHEPSRREEALALLRRLARAAPSADYPVEDAHFSERARQTLAGLQ
jgi:tetratricopeptide (TPR) repeat protein